MKTELTRLLLLRELVGFLGEQAQCAWWPTAFYEPAGNQFLLPVFPKTAKLARYHGVLEAARRVHDENLNVGSFHLFRLPEEYEQNLQALVQHVSSDSPTTEGGLSQEKALHQLREMAGTLTVHGDGPTAIGKIDEMKPSIMKAMAAAYFSAFSQNSRIYPYLVG